MSVLIRSLEPADVSAVLDLSLLAWEPVFASFRRVLGPRIYDVIYPDWRKTQREGVAKVCEDTEHYHTGVAMVDGAVASFITYVLDKDQRTGEVWFLAVHPDYQRRGIGTELNRWALAQMKAAGMVLAVVGTGGDEGHAPARRSYEKAGYIPLPLMRYYQYLGD